MQETTSEIIITENAARRIRELLVDEAGDSPALRIAVEGGGCSGFQYRFSVDTTPKNTHDILIGKDGAAVVVDDISLQLLAKSTLDYKESLAGAAFEIINPNSTARCGCGNSFSIA